MIIGILSDTHNNNRYIYKAVDVFRDHRVKTIIHCGDLTDPDHIYYFDGFHLIYIYGNMDGPYQRTIHRNVKEIGTANQMDNFAGLSYSGILDGIRISACHSHIPGSLESFIRLRESKYVFHGHTHESRDETILGTRVINPGSLGGTMRGNRSICILNTDTDELKFIEIAV